MIKVYGISIEKEPKRYAMKIFKYPKNIVVIGNLNINVVYRYLMFKTK